MSRRITSIDVARGAGVSQSTVSRVFNESSAAVTAATRERVLTVARQMGYQPNAIARMMSSQQTNIVGIVMAEITNPFYPYVLEKFLSRLQESNRQALLFTAPVDQPLDDILPLILQHQVDALIVTSATLSSAMAAQAAQAGMPVILFNRTVPGSQASAVCADNVEGGRKIANLLLDSGHQRLAYISGSANTSTNIDREKGFSDRLSERGVLHWQRAEAHYTYQSGYDAALSLLTGDERPDGIFAANDITALGAIDAARALGLRVGEDVSIAGFDDIPMAGWSAYNLTTIRQDVDTMIDRTIELMLDKIAEPASPATLRLVSGQVIVRASVRGLRPESAV